METFYFLITVANCSVKTVKNKTRAANRAIALLDTAKRLEYYHIDAIQIQNISESQYNVLPGDDILMTKPVTSVATKSPVFPV